VPDPSRESTVESALDVLEDHLALAEAALARGDAPEPRPWTEPDLAGRPTAAQEQRAAELQQRLSAVLSSLTAARARVLRDLSGLDGHRRAARSYGRSAGHQQSAQESTSPADG
jgi:hypothetical protein